MQLELSEAEASELKTALGNYLHELQAELVHTDDRALRKSLRETLERLETVHKRLSALHAGAGPN